MRRYQFTTTLVIDATLLPPMDALDVASHEVGDAGGVREG